MIKAFLDHKHASSAFAMTPTHRFPNCGLAPIVLYEIFIFDTPDTENGTCVCRTTRVTLMDIGPNDKVGASSVSAASTLAITTPGFAMTSGSRKIDWQSVIFISIHLARCFLAFWGAGCSRELRLAQRSCPLFQLVH